MNTTAVEALLVEYDVRPTPQRVVITQFVVGSREHPTAEDVHRAVRHRLPVALSRATVYNTLNTLVHSGVIKEVVAEPGSTRYDANLEKHHHFIDTKTGKIIDIPWSTVPELARPLKGKYKVNRYQITFYGELVNSNVES
jgi:Fur family transcriptional regulator, peroxide stress response regulator